MLRITVEGTHEHIVLEKNNNIDISNIPVYITRDGQIERLFIDIDKVKYDLLYTKFGYNKISAISNTFIHCSSS